jgi:hypothetical protein
MIGFGHPVPVPEFNRGNNRTSQVPVSSPLSVRACSKTPFPLLPEAVTGRAVLHPIRVTSNAGKIFTISRFNSKAFELAVYASQHHIGVG